MRPSLVNGQIAAATRGEFGNVQFTHRTSGGALFVNPLMAIFFGFTVDGLAARVRYLDRLADTVGMRQVATRIEEFREGVTTRIPRAFPRRLSGSGQSFGLIDHRRGGHRRAGLDAGAGTR